MNALRSFAWRVSIAYATVILVSLVLLIFFLRETPSEPDFAELEARQEREIALVATLVAPHLADSSTAPSPETLQELSQTLSQWLNGRVAVMSLSGAVLADSGLDMTDIDGDPPSNFDWSSDNYLLRARLGNVATAHKLVFHADPSRYLHTAAPIMIDGEIVGVLTLDTPIPDAPPAITPPLVWFAGWGLAAGLLALTAIGLVAGRSSRSRQALQDIIEGAEKLEQGDYEHRAPLPTASEIGPLTDAFNRMADTIQAAIGRLSSERDTLSAVLDTMADGVVVTGRAGQVTLLNPAARELLGIPARPVEGLRLVELVPDNEIHQVIARCHEEQTRQQSEISLLRPRRYLSAIATPLDNDGGALLTLHDLTRMRQVETSQKEFVSNVSHELRNPMASIKAMVETLESGAVNDPQVALDFLGRMRGDVDRINSLVDDLLELSRMESGQFQIEAEPMALANLVQSVKNQFNDVARGQEVAIVTEVPEELPPVLADGEKLTQVFVNLVENALKFTPAKGAISIRAQAGDEYVQVRLQDTGIGVAPQHLPHIFERFYKVNRSRRDSGTGLGLSIVKQLVEAHGGQITAESKEGEGTAFTFTVPIQRVP